MLFGIFLLFSTLGFLPLFSSMNVNPDSSFSKKVNTLQITRMDVENFLKNYVEDFISKLSWPLEDEIFEQAKVVFEREIQICPIVEGHYLEDGFKTMKENAENGIKWSKSDVKRVISFEVSRETRITNRLFAPCLFVQTALELEEFFFSLMPTEKPQTVQGVIDAEIEFYPNLYQKIDREMLSNEVKIFFDTFFTKESTCEPVEKHEASFEIPKWFWFAVSIDFLLGFLCLFVWVKSRGKRTKK